MHSVILLASHLKNRDMANGWHKMCVWQPLIEHEVFSIKPSNNKTLY